MRHCQLTSPEYMARLAGAGHRIWCTRVGSVRPRDVVEEDGSQKLVWQPGVALHYLVDVDEVEGNPHWGPTRFTMQEFVDADDDGVIDLGDTFAHFLEQYQAPISFKKRSGSF